MPKTDETVDLDPEILAAAARDGSSGSGVGTYNYVIREAEPNYAKLGDVLNDAYSQAASGKGRARHNKRGVAFDRQPIMEIGRMCGLGYPTGQAQKKTQEAVSMAASGEADRAVAELLGAINYLAAAVMLIREQTRS